MKKFCIPRILDSGALRFWSRNRAAPEERMEV
jgi:hypothetical protein